MESTMRKLIKLQIWYTDNSKYEGFFFTRREAFTHMKMEGDHVATYYIENIRRKGDHARVD